MNKESEGYVESLHTSQQDLLEDLLKFLVLRLIFTKNAVSCNTSW